MAASNDSALVSNDDDGSGSTDSNYASVPFIPECKSWPNFVESQSDVQHQNLPPSMKEGDGYNYYLNIPQAAWDTQCQSRNVNLSFAANNTTFILPISYRSLTWSTR